MRCPECTTNHSYKAGMKCACGYHFILDPKTDGIADGGFLAIVRRASANGTYYFTENQLHTAACRQKGLHPGWFLAAAPLLVVFAIFAFFLHPIAGGILGMLAFVSLSRGLIGYFSGSPTRAKVAAWVAKWRQSGGDLDQMITEPRLHEPPPEWSEADIYDYGVEGIVVVQRDLLVDLLVLNGFHSAGKVLVLSENGYPDYLVPIARKYLLANPDLPVSLLHDADSVGMTMQERLERSGLLPLDGHPILDLGLSADDARNMKRLKHTRPDRRNYEIPVDTLGYAALAGGLALALTEQATLGELIARHHTEKYDDTTSSFG